MQFAVCVCVKRLRAKEIYIVFDVSKSSAVFIKVLSGCGMLMIK